MKRVDVLKAKLNAAKKEKVIRTRVFHAARRGLKKVSASIHALENRIELART
jgi:hypothetical protein